MTTARRTSLIRHLRLDIGYEQDVSPAVLTSAILEALEPALIDEMGIVFVQAESAYTPGAGTLTIYAPVDQVKQEGEAPPQTPKEVEGEITAAGIKRARASEADTGQPLPTTPLAEGLGEGDRKPNVGQ